MKQHLLLWLLLLCSGSAWAQNLDIRESFEATASEHRYTSTTVATQTTNQYFLRASDPVTVNGSPTFGNSGTVVMTGEDGTYFWAAEGVRGTNATTPDPAKPAVNVTLFPIPNTQSYTNLRVTLSAGDPRGVSSSATLTRATDHLRVQYAYGSANGTYTTVGEFTKDPAATSSNTSFWTQIGAINADGSPAPTTTLTPTFTDFTFSIPAGTGDLYVRVEADFSGSNKEIAFDNIRVTGTASTVAKPTIVSTVGNSTLTFAEGTTTPLTIFSGLTLGNPAMTTNPTLSEASITISQYAGVEDELTYVIPSGSGITGPVSNTSGTSRTLTFLGTSSVSNYEALLESVKYRNTDANNATAGNRLFTFVVKAGTAASIPLERTVNITTALNGTSLLNYTENFDTDGEGTRYASNTRTANSQGFVRLTNASGGNATPGPAFTNGSTTTFTNVQGTGYWYANGTNGVQSTGTPGRVTLAPVDSRGFRNLRFKIKAGASGTSYDNADYLRFSYSTDGGASFVIFTNYFGTSSGSPLYNNGNTANPPLTTTLSDLDIALPSVSADATIIFRVEASNGGGEQIVFDNIQITGTQAPTVTTAAATSVTSTSAVLGGNVTADGGDAVTTRGVVYSTTNQTPTIGGTSVGQDANGIGTGSFSETIAGLAPGTLYYVRAFAINSVGTSYGAVVSFTTLAPVSGTVVVTNVNCFGGSTGTINLTPRGGVGPYTYRWNDGATTEDRNGLAAGTYSVTITDANGATGAVNNIIVTQPTTALSGTVLPTNVACNGGRTGGASVSATGGTAPYTYRWSTAATTQTVTGLAAGSYSVTITDANGCTFSRQFTITEPLALTAAVGQTNVTTNGGSDGTASITVSGGVPPYTYAWSPNVSTTATASNLRAGTYTVTVTDANTCTITRSFTITEAAPALTASISSTAGASGSTTATSPIPFTVTFSQSATGFTASDVVVTGGTASGFTGSGTTYTFNVTPSASGTVTVNVPANSAVDGNNTGNTAATQYSLVYAQPVTATPVITSPANNSFTNQPSVTISGTAPTGSAVTVYVSQNGGAFQDVGTYTATAGGTFTTPAIPFPGATYQTYAVAQSPGAAVSANSTLVTFTVDQNAPTVAITSTAGTNGSTTTTTPIPYTVTFSEAVTGFVAGDVTVSNGTILGFTGSGTTYTFNVTPITAGTTTTVNVPSNVAVDRAGNGNSAATQLSITYQQLVTAAPVVTAPANGNTLNTATPTYTGTAPANSTVTVYVDNTAIGTTTATGGTFSLMQPTTLADGNHTVRATAQLSGNTVSASSNTNTFTVDTTAPTVVLGSTATNPTATSPIPVTVTFSESVTGFGASSVTVTNGILSGFSGSGSLYTFSVTPSAAGTVMVNIAANVAQDAAGNGNVAAPQFSITYVVPATFTTWTGTVSTDWYTAGNWTAGVPTATLDAIIPASAPRYPLVAAGTASAKNLSINSGASLSQSGGIMAVRVNLTNNGTFSPTGGTVTLGTSTQANILGSSSIRFWDLTIQSNGVLLSTSAGASVQRVLALTGNLITNGNPFTLLSSSTGDALVNNNGGVVVGTATVQRYIDPSVNAGLGARHYSAPVSNTTVADLATSGYTPVLNPAFNTAAKPAQVRPFPTVFGYDQSRLTLVNTLPTFDKGFFSPTSFSDPLQVGQGYVVNLASTELVDFVGTLNNGDVTTTMASNRDTYTNDGGWQLVGNPYPAPLDYGQVAAADRASLDASLYVYSSTSQYQGQYRAYVRGVGGNSVVSSGQGFFVRVSSGQTTGSLTLRNAYRLTAPNATTFQRTTAETRPLVQLTLQGTGSASDDAYVYFENGATSGLDAQFDAVKMPNTTGLNLSTSISGQQLAIDGRAELGKAQQIVPLAVGVPTVGTYTFTTAQLLNLANVPVYLRDLQLGTITDLRLTPSYQFTVTNAAALITGRFELVFSPQQALATVPAALAQQVALYPNPAKKAAFVELPASLGRQAVTATLVDALGRQVRTVQLPAQGSVAHPLDLSDLATGVYALRLSTSAGVVVKKLVVE